jgi:hypothetical protein
MSAQRSLLAGALCLVGMGLASPASAKIYLDGEWIVDGHAKHEVRTTFTGTCSAD